MKNTLLIIFVALIIVITGFLILKQTNLQQQSAPADFNFIFRYGIEGKNELNTFSQTYTKDMITDSPVTISFELTDEEKVDVYKKINKLKLLDMKVAPIESSKIVTPCSSYSLRIQANYSQNDLTWDNCQGKVNDKLKEFTDYIIKIIESKEEYKALPTPKGGYL